jgi:hypothetical protein
MKTKNFIFITLLASLWASLGLAEGLANKKLFFNGDLVIQANQYRTYYYQGEGSRVRPHGVDSYCTVTAKKSGPERVFKGNRELIITRYSDGPYASIWNPAFKFSMRVDAQDPKDRLTIRIIDCLDFGAKSISDQRAKDLLGRHLGLEVRD